MSSRRRKFTLKKGLINIVALFFVVASVLLLNEAVKEMMKSSQTKKDLVLIEQEIKELEKDNEDLEGLKAKLSDSNYVQNYLKSKSLFCQNLKNKC